MQLKFQQSSVVSVDVPQIPFIDRVVDISAASQRQVRSVLIVQKTGDSPGAVLRSVETRPSLCNDRLYGADSAETVEVPQVQYWTGWSMFLLLQFTDKVGRSCDLAVTELMGFLAHFAPFSRSSGLSRS